MELTVAQRSLGYITAGLGFFQGLAWFIMSIICLTYYYEGGYVTDFKSYMGAWNQMVAVYLFDRNARILPGQSLVAATFVVFMFFYVFLSTGWVTVSVLQFFAVFKRTLWVYIIYRAWAAVMVLVIILDLVLTAYLISDIRLCNELYGQGLNDIAQQQVCTDVVVPIFLISTRGFVLGVMNFILASLLVHVSRDIRKVALFGHGVPRDTVISRIQPHYLGDNHGRGKTAGSTNNGFDNSEEKSTVM